VSDWEPIEAPVGTWSRVGSAASEWNPVSDGGSCGDWADVNADGDCLDWDAHLCWILQSGYWADSCFWKDLALWNDGSPFWGEVAA